jgi:hypothetical protein
MILQTKHPLSFHVKNIFETDMEINQFELGSKPA